MTELHYVLLPLLKSTKHICKQLLPFYKILQFFSIASAVYNFRKNIQTPLDKVCYDLMSNDLKPFCLVNSVTQWE